MQVQGKASELLVLVKVEDVQKPVVLDDVVGVVGTRWKAPSKVAEHVGRSQVEPSVHLHEVIKVLLRLADLTVLGLQIGESTLIISLRQFDQS